MGFLTTAEYPAVRAAIDTTLSVRNLPDSVIGLPQFQQEAERWVLATSTIAATYEPGSDEFKQAQVAAIYACAALLMPSMPVLTGETYGQAYRYTRKEVDLVATAESLWTRARAALAAAEGEVAAPEPVAKAPSRFVFTTARARCRW